MKNRENRESKENKENKEKNPALTAQGNGLILQTQPPSKVRREVLAGLLSRCILSIKVMLIVYSA